MQYKRAHDIIYVDDSIHKGPHYEICTIDRSVPNWQGHASLIVAAPELLSICETIIKQHKKPGPWEFTPEFILSVEEAIRKAKGEK